VLNSQVPLQILFATMNKLYISNTADQKLVMKDISKDFWTTARWALTTTRLGHMMPTASARFERATSETTVLLINYYLSSIQAHFMMLWRLRPSV